ncbi:MAG TPA: HNH endonuclease [Sedimentisphaerales bacterium]|nr:HNH endonuclease [Sedimentisphaerales bacterium]
MLTCEKSEKVRKEEGRREGTSDETVERSDSSTIRLSNGQTEHREAVCQALAEACSGCPLFCEGRATRDERRSSPACCANCAYCGRMRDGDACVPICANTPDAPGEIVRIDPAGNCPDYRPAPEPIVHGVPPQPADDSVRYIPLTRGKYAIVDKADYEWLRRYKWCTLGGGERSYACRREHGKTIYMHREIMQAPPDLCVDHIHGVTLDNRRANLRLCTPSENMRNRRGNCDRDLPKGVTWQSHCNKYKASIGIDGAPKHIGYYDDPIEAAKAYDRKAIELFGEVGIYLTDVATTCSVVLRYA